MYLINDRPKDGIVVYLKSFYFLFLVYIALKLPSKPVLQAVKNVLKYLIIYS